MPECRKCHRVGASCDYRRTSLGAVCRDKWTCSIIVKNLKSARTAREVERQEK